MESLKDIIVLWGLDKVKILKIINKPSSEVASEDLKKQPENQITKWKNTLSKADLIAFQEVLDYFQITSYNMKSGKPDSKHFYN